MWGGLNALYFLPLLLLKRNRTNLVVVAEGRMLPNLRETWQMGTTFLLTVLAWVFFRSPDLSGAFQFLFRILSASQGNNVELPVYIISIISILLIIEWKSKSEIIPSILFNNGWQSFVVSSIMLWFVVLGLLGGNPEEFIYFQF